MPPYSLGEAEGLEAVLSEQTHLVTSDEPNKLLLVYRLASLHRLVDFTAMALRCFDPASFS